MNQRYDLLAFSLILFSVLLTAAMGIVPPAMREIDQSLYGFLKDWQTLIAGILALVVAIFALRPVWRQVAKMNIQSSIMARDVLAKRLSQMESRRKKNSEKIGSITSDFYQEILIWEDDEEPRFVVDATWAHSAELTTYRVARELLEDQRSKRDSVEIDLARNKVIDVVHRLNDCLEKIHSPHSRDLDDPFYNLTEDSKRKIREDAEAAEDDLPKRIGDVVDAGDELDVTFNAEIDKLRMKIRGIDDLIVRDQLT